MLNELNLKSVYDSSRHDLVEDLFIPLLRESIRYDRGVGFFSSGWLRQASRGLIELAKNCGEIRMVISPIISEEDWEAMKRGNIARKNKILHKILMDTVIDLEKTLEDNPKNALAWLIADKILTIKFAIPIGRLKGGDFHDKFGIFEDIEGNRLAIHGSYNDTVHGSLNGESFSVFKSWKEGQIEYVDNHDQRFCLLFNNKNPMFKIYEIPDAVKLKIIRFRKFVRPYQFSRKKKKAIYEKKRFLRENRSEIILRDYQQKALDKWIKFGLKGIFEMATGTGKTITSLACASYIFNDKGEIALIISVPYLHLIEQWQKEMKKFGFYPVRCSSQNPNWEKELQLKIQDYNLGFRKDISCLITHSSAATDRFQNLIRQIKGPHIMAIFDEVHSLGSSKLQNALSENFEYRIGLSATPQRWYDAHGTQIIMQYFHDVCFSFPLEKAIGKFLVEYKYIPHIIELNEDEFYEYCQLSSLIGKIFHSNENPEENSYLSALLRARKKLINDASQKNSYLRSLLKEELQAHSKLNKVFSHTLFYCPVGGHLKVLRIVADMDIRAREFIYKVNSKERKQILEQFSNGEIQALIAIKCLDEGVDVPATKKAFILASTTNPREFIQRRGRVLRMHENKKEAVIHDFIVFPPLKDNEYDDSAGDFKLSVIKREMPRFAEFASTAMNEFEARNSVRDILKKFKVEYLLDIKPWDIYAENSPENLDLYELEEE